MLAQSGEPLGHSFLFYDLSPGEATEGIGKTLTGGFSDLEKLSLFAKQCDVITYEFENIPCETAHFLSNFVSVYPPPRALEVSQDRLMEKTFFTNLGLGTPRFAPASTKQELIDACDLLGYPCVIKTRRLGYDGKGQARASDRASVDKIWSELGSTPLIVEAFVPFSRELSIIGVRTVDGAIAIYPLAHNIHVNGILHRSEIPAPSVSRTTAEEAIQIITKVMNNLEYVGVLTIELFDVSGTLLINEIAPRVHNSGHASIDSVATSQFENHIRAITGMPLGSTKPLERGVMYNIVGTLPALDSIRTLPETTVHLYGKTERTGRKIGHITLLNPTPDSEAVVAAALAER
jgi:5-(carboxyamino)imidazole ribonucleotide synthase